MKVLSIPLTLIMFTLLFGASNELATCYFVGSAQPPKRHIHGYPVEHCLMNRITFEQQRLQVSVCS